MTRNCRSTMATAAPAERATVAIEDAAIGHLAEDLTVPCEGRHESAPPAEWIVWWTCPCPPGYALLCTDHKDRWSSELDAEMAILCEGCGQTFAPAPTAIRLIEPLNRRPQ